MNKVLLIAPPDIYGTQLAKTNQTMPFGILYIASYLEKYNIPVSCLDCFVDRLSLKQLAQRIEQSKPDIVGISYSSAQRMAAHKTAQIVKEIDSGIKVVVGGPHVTYLAEATLKHCRYIDIVVIGEGEITMLEIVNGKCLEEIKGIAFRRDEEIIVNPLRPPILDLDSLLFPARHLLDFKKYQDKTISAKLPCATMLTSRGCPYRCTYCATAFISRKIRQRSPENVVEEIVALIKDYDIKAVNFVDDNVLISKKWVDKFCNLLIDNKINVAWHCLSRVDSQAIDKETLHLMKKSGCYWISFGVESGSPGMLKKLKKGINLQQINKAFELTTAAGIHAKGFFMVGFPEETPEDVKKTVNLKNRLPLCEAPVAVCMLFPGSEMTNNSHEIDNDFWFQEFYSPLPYTESTIPIARGEKNRLVLSEIASYMDSKDCYHHFFSHTRFRIKVYRQISLIHNPVIYFLYYVIPNFFLGNDRFILRNNISFNIKRFSSLLKELEGDSETYFKDGTPII